MGFSYVLDLLLLTRPASSRTSYFPALKCQRRAP